MGELVDKARQRSNTMGAPDALNFLRNHVNKINEQLQGQPGAPTEASPSKPSRSNSKGKGASEGASPAPRPTSSNGSGAASEGRTNSEAVVKAIAEGE